MSRTITNAMVTALTTTIVRAEFMLELDYASGPVRIWTGLRDVTWSGSTWNAAGTFQGIQGMQETSELRAVGAQVAISGIPAANLSLALTENIRNRDMTMRIACLSTSNAIIADPLILFKGKLDQEVISEQGKTAAINISAESKLIDIGRTKRLLFTHEDQQLSSTSDLGCEYVSALANEPLTWGI